MPDITFTASTDSLKGKRAAVVARMVELLAEAGTEDVVTWDELIAGVEHPHQYTPALHALELVGAIRRWDYKEPNTKGHKTAYSLVDGVEVQDLVLLNGDGDGEH